MNAAELAREGRRWLRWSEEDLEVADAISQDGDLTPRAACFHAQQAAEKAIKAALVISGVNFPRIHDLDALRNLLPEGWSLKVDFPKLGGLSSWATDARYPADLPDIGPEDATQAVSQARGVYECVREDCQRRRLDPDVAEDEP